MLMTIKNKMLLGMDRLIEETKKKGGVPANISLDVQEAADFLREIQHLKIEIRKYLSVKHANNTDTDFRFLLQSVVTKEGLGEIIKQWYNKEFVVTYKGVEIRVVKTKKPNVPKPLGPLNRILSEDSFGGHCEKCGSSLHSKWIFWDDGCIQPKCENYYKND